MTLQLFRQIYADTIRAWLRDNAASQGAALAFYSILSLGPLLLIIVSIAGLMFGADAASGRVSGEIRGLVGYEGAQAIQGILANSRNETSGFWAAFIGIVTLVFASTAVFGQLQDTLNHIWKVEAKRGFWRVIRKRVLSFAMILVIGFLLLISLLVATALTAFGDFITGVPPLAAELFGFAFSLAVETLLFAMIFKILPDIRIRWRDVWIGAALTALLFSFGKALIGFYLGHSDFATTYGAAGSLVVVLVWVYYSAQILFLGAEFTKVQASYATGRKKH